ncbi:glycosyltransferase family 4 protein [Patescibacteria group bacterium]|nr:glycosyltransferase family 4 protein [Patescibacteria group bacterium]
MKVLFISAILPYPLHSGGQVRLYNLLKLLSKKHDITLYTFIRNENERQYVKELSFIKKIKLYLRGRVWQPKYMFRSMTSSLPLLLSSYEHEEMKKDVACELEHEQYDLVHLEPFYVCPSMPEEVKGPMVVAEHNIEYEVYESYVKQFPISFLRPFLHMDVAKIKKQEETLWGKAHNIIAVSGHDASVIRSSVGGEKVTVIPNGVDTSYFSYEKKLFNRKHPSFLFVGNFYWVPNVKAVERLFGEIWPKVFEEIPHAHLTVVGKHLPQKLQEEAKALHIAYKEHVEDIRDAYKSSDILLAPMTILGGTKFKILEAMGSGCLVVTTKEGMEGIEVQNGIHYYEASLASEYVSAIQNVYDHPSKSRGMTTKARKVIENKYDWKSQAMKLSIVWEKTI